MIPLVINNVGSAINNGNKLNLAEKALIDSSQFYKQIIQSAQEGIIVYDLYLQYVGWNPFMENLTGIQSCDVLGKHPWEVFPFLQAAGVIINLEKALQGEVIPEVDVYFEIPVTGKSGWVSEKISTLFDTSGKITGVIVTVRNITERRLTEEKLKESEEKYRYIFANNPQPMWLYDLETLAFLEVNDAAIHHYGYSRDEFMKMTLKDIRPAEDIGLLVENIKMISSPQNSAEVYRHTKKNGEIIYVEITAHSMLFNGRKARHILINDITTRTLAEKQLKLLSKAIEQSPVTVLITDKEGHIEYANPKFTEITGYSLEEVKGKRPNILKSGTQPRAFYETLWTTILAGKEWSGEFHNKKKNGESYWESAVISSIVNNHGEITFFIAVKEDITERKKMIEELIISKEKAEESEFRLIEAQKTAHIGHWNWNFKKKQLIWSDEIFNIFGLSKESFLVTAESFERFIHPDDLDDFKRKRVQCLEIGEEINIDHRIVRTNGEIRFVQERSKIIRDGNNQPINVVGTVQDITELKQIEIDLVKAKEKAEESEYRLKLATASGKLGIWDWNLMDNSMIWDDRMFELYGITRDTFPINIDAWTNGLHPEDKQRAIEDCNAALNGEGDFNTSFRVLHPDGKVLHLKAAGSIIRNSDGKPLRMIGINRDITENRLAAQQLEIAKEKAEESDRLKSAFLANMSHEIRTPLNGILGFSELLNDPDFDQEQKTEFTKTIVENSNQLLVIINDIMDISMLEARQITIRKEQFAIHQLFVDLKNGFSAKVNEKKLQFQINVPSGSADKIIENDYYRMRQVFTNLIGNALKFTNSGCIEIGFMPKEEGVEFYVKDTGIGIAPEFHKDIFERFRQVDESKTRKYGGNGLGLAISKNLVEMLGGRIWVESEEEIGSTFYFILTDNGNGELVK